MEKNKIEKNALPYLNDTCFRSLCLAADDLDMGTVSDRARLADLITESLARQNDELTTWLLDSLRLREVRVRL